MAAKNGQEMNSVIGEGSIFEGKFYINGSLQIDGRFEGDIRTDEHVLVGETGKVKTDIVARRVIVAGTVIGNIEACLLYTSPSPRDRTRSRMPSSA